MPPPRPAPSVRLRRLAAQLRDLREAKGPPQEDVPRRTGKDRSTLYRLETAQQRPQRATLIQLLDLYQAGEPRRGELLTLLREASQRGWMQHRRTELPGVYSDYIGFEEEARTISNYESLFIPGLLQTEDYARAQLHGTLPHATAEEIQHRVTARLERQQLLTRATPPRLWAILDEAAARRQVGRDPVMAAQPAPRPRPPGAAAAAHPRDPAPAVGHPGRGRRPPPGRRAPRHGRPARPSRTGRRAAPHHRAAHPVRRRRAPRHGRILRGAGVPRPRRPQHRLHRKRRRRAVPGRTRRDPPVYPDVRAPPRGRAAARCHHRRAGRHRHADITLKGGTGWTPPASPVPSGAHPPAAAATATASKSPPPAPRSPSATPATRTGPSSPSPRTGGKPSPPQ